jgi:hypothetical protein
MKNLLLLLPLPLFSGVGGFAMLDNFFDCLLYRLFKTFSVIGPYVHQDLL